MRRFFKWLVAIIIVLLGLSAIWEPILAREEAPPPAQTYDARIVRDEFGVPHIFGKRDADTAYGLAYAHAEDDFGTIAEVIAMTRGRTGAMIGTKGAPVDYVFHLIGARQTVDRDYASIPADTRAMLEAYAAGLNLYAARHPDEVPLRKLFPVNGKDVATGFVLRSPFFFGLDDSFKALLKDTLPPRPKEISGTLSAKTALADKTPRESVPGISENAETLTPIGTDPGMNGSNAFAVAPRRMADGKTWLISNSHQPYEGSVAWYEASVHSGEGLDMAGALFPGSPFILMGHNRDLGWTNTVNRPDLVDIYKLVLNDAGDQYRFEGKWLPLESCRVWLPVRYGPFTLPIPRTVWRSIHGPVIVNTQGAFAIRYAGIDQAKMLEQYYRITKARDWSQWTKAMDIGGTTATNFIYADRTGRIAYIYYALFPKRQPGFDWAGILPGDKAAALWPKGSVGFAAMPKLVDPVSGFVTNANNTPFLSAGPGSEMNPKDWSPLLGIEARLTNRGIRAVELMSADRSITPEELLTIKFDTAYSKSSYVGPWMAQILAADMKGDPELVAAQKLLATWDWKSDGKGAADTLAELMVRAANLANYRNEPYPDPRTELKVWVDHLNKYVGRIDPPLFEFQRLRRGNVDLGMDGGTDALRATSIWDREQKDGKGRVKHGDSFIMLINWDKAGRVASQSIQPYGAATNRPDSPHYTDQMKLFVDHRFKPVHFEKADILTNAKRAYRP